MRKFIALFFFLLFLFNNKLLFCNQKSNNLKFQFKQNNTHLNNKLFHFNNSKTLPFYINPVQKIYLKKHTISKNNLFFRKYNNILAVNYSDEKKKIKFNKKKKKEKEFKEIIFRDIIVFMSCKINLFRPFNIIKPNF